MRNNLLINGNNAAETYGVVMGSGFIDAIEASLQLKEHIVNNSRLSDGQQMLVSTKKAERTILLKFNIHGASKIDFLQKKAAFESVLYGGIVTIQIVGRTEIYHLVYTGKSVTYNHSYNGHFGVWSGQFIEPNPSKRTATADPEVRLIRNN